RRASSPPAAATVATTSPVKGSRSSKVAPSAASTQLPPMNCRYSRVAIISPSSLWDARRYASGRRLVKTPRAVYTSCMAAQGERLRLAEPLIFVLSIASALSLWELVSRTSLISQQDLPAMSTSFRALWSLMQTGDFWVAFAQTVRGWAVGLGIATALAVPIGILLGSSDFAARAFRVPIEFLRPIPSAALIPLLFLTLGTTLKSEIFLATFGAFWPLLVQTMYGVRDVDPLAIDTGRSFGVGRLERLVRIKLPSSCRT